MRRNESLLAVIAACALLAPAAAEADGGAMVLAAAGDVTVRSAAGGSAPGAPMLIVDAGDVVKVGRGGAATLASFGDRSEAVLVGPAEVRVLADRIEVLSGDVTTSAPRRALALPKRTTLTSRAVLGQVSRSAGGASVRFVDPANFGCLLDPATPLRWTLGSGTPARLVVWDDDGREVFRTDVEGETFAPPDGSAGLQAGGAYYAEVTAIGARGPTARSEFRILGAAEAEAVRQAEAAARAPSAGGGPDASALMLLMVTYVENRLYERALEVSRELEPLVPDRSNLLRLRALVHDRLGESDLARADLEAAEGTAGE